MNIAKRIKKEANKNFIINLILNGVIAYLIFKGRSSIPIQGKDGFGVDLFATVVLLSLMLSYIVIAIYRKDDSVTRSEFKVPHYHQLALWLPSRLWLAALLISVMATVTVFPATLAAFLLVDVHTLSPIHYAVFKAFWTGILAYALTPLSIAYAMQNPKILAQTMAE